MGNLFDGFNVIKDTFKDIKKTFATPKAAPRADPAIALEAEEKKKREARKQALADLNPTGTLGAGTAQTTRSKVLGV